MNSREKEVLQAQLNAEKEVLKQLEKQYKRALHDIEERVKLFDFDLNRLDNAMSEEGLDDAAKAVLQSQRRSRVYQKQYQEALRGQISGILDKLHGDEYATIQQYLDDSYVSGFVGTMYDIAGQGVPLIMPIDQAAAVRAVQLESKVSKGYYDALGVDIKDLKKSINAEVSRGIATGMNYSDIARNINNVSKTGLSNAKRIARTEAHRIQQASTMDAQRAAKAKGADVVKQWDATMDGKTRTTHRQLDGQIREIDEDFEIGGMKAKAPGYFGRAAEDINCRCVSLTRARWALDEDELATLKKRAEYFGLAKEKAPTFEAFQKQYLKTTTEWASADTALAEFLGADSRDVLTKIIKRGTVKLPQGIACFPDGDPLTENAKRVVPKKNFFDVAMHGSSTAVGFGSKPMNMSPRLLAAIIRRSEGYTGQNIRLLSCKTGLIVGDDMCFAEELANALGVIVEAPNDTLYISVVGELKIGLLGRGKMIPYKPNERRRLK